MPRDTVPDTRVPRAPRMTGRANDIGNWRAVPLVDPMEKLKHLDFRKRILSAMYRYPRLNRYEGFIGRTPVVGGDTYIGVEVELEHVDYYDKHLSNSVWKAMNDGSLKERGKEFVTRPIRFKFLEIELMRLYEVILAHKVTDRCSTHVHMNVRDMSLYQLRNFIALYMVFEKSMFNYSGNRWRNIHCVPMCNDISRTREFVRSLEVGHVAFGWSKYSACNLSPIYGGDGSDKIGTIEFRHMIGTVDSKYLIGWINLITSLKLAAKSWDWEEIYSEIVTMNETSKYTLFAEQVFKQCMDLIVGQPTFKQDVEFCITAAKKVFCQPKVIAEEITILKKGT